jgi:uncharacterized membrane protein YeaQ/YmgE (transglycosylase-associated protein family)
MDEQTYNEKQRLLRLNQRQLNKVKEQIAHFGKYYAPPHKLIEEEDLQKEIDELQHQLAEKPEEVTFDKILDNAEKVQQLESEVKRALEIYRDAFMTGHVQNIMGGWTIVGAPVLLLGGAGMLFEKYIYPRKDGEGLITEVMMAIGAIIGFFVLHQFSRRDWQLRKKMFVAKLGYDPLGYDPFTTHKN